MKRRGRLNRRAFLRSVGATPLAWWLTSFERSADGAAPPQRFMMILRPNGTIRADWMPTATGTTFTLPGISSAFESLRSNMVFFDGINLVNSGGGASTHEGGMNTLLTGSPVSGVRPQPNDWKNTAASVDQILLTRSPNFMGRQALYIASDGRVDNSKPQVANRAIAYTGPDKPVYPELKPTLVYSRIFSQLVPGGQTNLLRVRARRQSVLDFIKSDLTNATTLAPASQRPRLEQHAAVIRDLEKMLDATTAPGAPVCAQPTSPTDVAINVNANIGVLGAQHLALVQAAFVCDLTRLVFFMWTAAASSAVWENLYPGMPRYNHHALSHEDLTSASVAKPLAAIDRWFAEHTATFLSTLKATSDGTGTLLDNTLVLYGSEVADGDHNFKNMPIALSGGAGVRLQGGRLMKLPGRSMNDLWLSIAGIFGVQLTSLGAPEQSTGPIAGVFS